jgi:ribonucleoside-diphosphate reductase alpha chain
MSANPEPWDGTTEPVRRQLPDDGKAITHKFDITGYEGFITVGLYEDGQPGEIFLVMAKEGSMVSGLADAFARAVSLALQYGVPLEALEEEFSNMRFEPSGMTRNPNIRFAKSIVDYIFRWLAMKFPKPVPETPPLLRLMMAIEEDKDAPPCSTCGSIMVRSGSCYNCVNCGNTTGCT